MALRHFLFGSAGLLAFGAQAFSQQGGPAETAADQAGDVVVITGSALARKEALEEKKDESRTIEALGVDELGQLPDKNVGESLNRLPGVSMLVEKGEGRYVQVRGVASNLNNVTINGVQMGSPEVELGGRQAPLDIISGGVLGGVQVIKTPTPDMDAQGIGGTVNVETKMPFDRPEDFYGYLTGRYGYEEERPRDEAFGGHDPYAVDGTLSGKIGDTLGWLVGGTFSAREYVSTGIYQDDWTQVPGQPAGTFLPVNVKNNYYIIGRERLNLSGALQWRPDDTSEYFVRGFYGSWDEYQWRNRYEQNLTGSRVTLTSPTAGTQNTDRILANVRLEYADKIVSSVAAGGENQVGQMKLDYLVQMNANEIAEPNSSWEWRSGATAVGPSTFALDGDGIVTITPNAGTPDRTNPNLLPLRRARFFTQDMNEDATIAQINAQWDASDEIFFKTGVKISTTDRTLDVGQTEYLPNGTPITLGTSPQFNKGGFANQTQNGDVPNIWMDVHGMNAYFRDPANTGRFTPNTAANFTSNFASDYDLKESILAGYVMASGEFGPWELIGGVRIEATDVDSSGYLLRGATSQSRVNAGGDYTETLPALLVNFRPDEAWVVRAAVTRALGRPDYNQIAPRSTFSQNGAIGSVSIGNPDLVARKSWNYDLGVEWYPDQLTALSAAIFYKDISDQLAGQTNSFQTQAAMQAELATRGLTGIDTTGLTRLDVSTTINAGSAFLQGVELSAQTQFDFLPSPFDGFGASISATFIDGEVDLPGGGTAPLQGQPESTYAFTGFYQKGPIDISVSYAYNASFLDSNNANPGLTLDQGEFGRWDAKASYSINDNLKIFLEGVNLNDEPTSEFQGGKVSQNTEFEYVGRTVYLGASWGF
ncbi:MAG: TonB-dependent receptor [Hyphomonadaceae bacterium]|nr:TonB-dependent receptor [Hyphomonadaceae bacterium]